MLDIIVTLIMSSSDSYEEAMWSGDIYCAQLLNNTPLSPSYDESSYIVEEVYVEEIEIGE